MAALLWAAIALSPAPTPAQQPQAPVADPDAVVTLGHARFTVLTPRMVRMEWSADGRFEDRASLVFLTRKLPVPEYETSTEGQSHVIDTGALQVRYRGEARFDSTNLEVRLEVAGRTVTWRPGTADTANLGGTIRTLDGVGEPVPLGDGLLSRDGWAIVDDSDRPVLDGSEWPWAARRPPGERVDWTFLGYGHDYAAALGDFARVAGYIPIPPRFAFGAWWSRYWAYTDAELVDLVGEFDDHGVPLDVLVIDMDWHNTFELRWRDDEQDQAGQRKGWTGYTWDRAYFPAPERFLTWAEAHGLKTPLNLHPASGIQPHEAQYEAMALAEGIDPTTRRYVPFRIEDKGFARHYFDLVIHPLERQGVDFWWLDWQQWSETSVPGLNPTFWLNYVFFTDFQRHRPDERPILFHRYGGLGNHRYQIGFSGDAHSTWTMLAFEPLFTATASNVLYGYWSHDIGGHLPGTVSPELYTRWIQFGVFSPILRTHTTKNPEAERRIWAYPPEYFDAMRRAFQRRYALIPYLYTAARAAYETGVSPVRPMYYGWPESDEAYRFGGQYMFGPDLLVSPVTSPMDSSTLLAGRDVWLPPGEWYEWDTGSRLAGPAVVHRSFALDEIPVYARAGAIIPMAPPTLRSGARPLEPLILSLFPGDSGSARVYEDAGDSPGYLRGDFARTTVRQHWSTDRVRITVSPAQGSYPGMPQARALELRLPGTWPPQRVSADGSEVEYRPDGRSPGWRYDGDRVTTIIALPSASVRRAREVVIELPADRDPTLLDGVPGRLSRLHRAARLLENLWPDDWPRDQHIGLEQTGRRMSLHPDSAAAELRRLEAEYPDVVAGIRALQGDRRWIDRALGHLGASLPGQDPSPRSGPARHDAPIG